MVNVFLQGVDLFKPRRGILPENGSASVHKVMVHHPQYAAVPSTSRYEQLDNYGWDVSYFREGSGKILSPCYDLRLQQ